MGSGIDPCRNGGGGAKGLQHYPGSRTVSPFLGEEGAGDLIAGEVSSVNDDRTDNCFLQQRDRFSVIEEDEEVLFPPL